MLACTDVHYGETVATGALVLFASWSDASPLDHRLVKMETPDAYRPGHFFERELPVLLELLRGAPPLEAVIVDGYVWLGADGERGLGAHLFEALGRTTPVIGVAKTAYRGSTFAERVLRGASKRPLYVTAAGLEPARAAELIRGMHGDHRLPTLLGEVDRRSRGEISGRTPLRPRRRCAGSSRSGCGGRRR